MKLFGYNCNNMKVERKHLSLYRAKITDDFFSCKYFYSCDTGKNRTSVTDTFLFNQKRISSSLI